MINTYYVLPQSTEAYSYSWSLPAGWAGTSTSNVIEVVPNNNAGNISVVASNNCGSSNTTNRTISVAPVNVRALSGGDDLHIHPNPSNGSIIVTSAIFATSEVTYQLIDMLGRVIEHGAIAKSTDVKRKFHWEHLPKGVYILKLKNKETNRTSTLSFN